MREKKPIPPYIKGVIINSTLNRSRENLKNEEKKKYRKNESSNGNTLR